MKKSIIISLSLSTLFIFSAFSQSEKGWICTHRFNELIRKVNITFSAKGCSVVYFKPMEQDKRKVIFSAQGLNKFCDEKANDFIHRRLENELGWKCETEKFQ